MKRTKIECVCVILTLTLSIALPAFGQTTHKAYALQVQRGNPSANVGANTYSVPARNVDPRWMGASANYRVNSNAQSYQSQEWRTEDRLIDRRQLANSGWESAQTREGEEAWALRQNSTTTESDRRLTANDEWWNDNQRATMRSSPVAVNGRENPADYRSRPAVASQGWSQTSAYPNTTNLPGGAIGGRIGDVSRVGQSVSGITVDSRNRAVFGSSGTSINSAYVSRVTNTVSAYRGGNNFGAAFVVGPNYRIGPGFYRPERGWEYCSGYRFGGAFVSINFGPAYDGILVNSAEFVPPPWYYNMDDGYWYDDAGQSFASAPNLGPEVPIGVLVPVRFETGYGVRRVLVLENAAYVPSLGTYGWWNSYGGGFARLSFGVRTGRTWAGAFLGY